MSSRKTKTSGCSEPGCPNAARAKGRCPKHYYAQRRKEAGLKKPASLGPNPRWLEFAVTKEKGLEIDRHVGEGSLSDFMRRAVDTQMALERGAGKAVTL